MQLLELKASNLRGLPADWPEVPIGERGLVVFGPNGTGKSSIIDGIEYALTGNSTLYAQLRQGVNWAAGAPHVRGGRMSATLTVQDSGAAHTITGGAAPPAAVAPWCELAAKSSFILRRHMLLRFVDTQPRNRYDRLEPFLNLDDYIKIEVALGELAGAAQTELSAMEAVHRAKEQNVRAIFRLQQADLVSEDTLRSALNRRLKEVGVQEIENLDELDALKTRVSNELGGNEKHQRGGQLQGAH